MNNEIKDLLNTISSIEPDNLSINQVYQFIENIKEKALSITELF
jgi:hypothetical protein